MTTHTDPPNASDDGVDDERLPCGRLLSRVWDDWEQQSDDPHRQSCPHCRNAVLGLEDLEVAVRDLRDETADSYASEATSLTRRVMEVVRLELRPGRPVPLGEPDEDLWIMEAVAARALRAAAETVSGVRAGSCRFLPHPTPESSESSTTSDAFEGPFVVRLAIHAPAGVPLPELAEEVRGRVREAADRELGVAVAAIDVHVTDLIHSADDSQGGRT
ncbi:Asp23/Gls24 family envelope stress response protein [Streptomyces sp. NPDC020707]|uniref:Asp23/Gls24 family envelope stress response protein n=1 Tax=Streptomyces sp. NPDC020707 TaxID=3365084 RepID=UPI0037A5B04E